MHQKVCFFLLIGIISSHSKSAFAEKKTDATPVFEQDNSVADIPPLVLPPSKQVKQKTSNEMAEQENLDLFLYVSVNSYPNTDLIHTIRNKKNQFFISAKDLKAMRILIDKSIAEDYMFNLSDISWMTYNYNEVNQTLNLNVPETKLEMYLVNIRKENKLPASFIQTKPLLAAVMNYNIYSVYSNNQNLLSGSADLTVNAPIGNFYSTLIYRGDQDANAGGEPWVRLSSSWQYFDPVHIRSYTLGDLTTNTTAWGASVRLAGFQWASAYAQRSDIITTALPEFSGSAALPSSLDLYVNQQRVYSGLIPSGPFNLLSLPSISGGKVTLVAKDVTGQETTLEKTYYSSPKILAKGVNQFSLDGGIPRYNTTSESNNYDTQVFFGSGSVRYGWTPTLTLSAGAESSTDGLLNLGVGFNKNIIQRGILSTSLAFSRYKGQVGSILTVDLETRFFDNMTFNASLQNTYQRYYNLGRVADARYKETLATVSSDLENELNTVAAQQIFRTGLSYNFSSSINAYINYNQIVSKESTYQQATVGSSFNIHPNWSVFVSGYQDLVNKKNYGMFASLRFTPPSTSKIPVSINTSIAKENEITTNKVEALGVANENKIGWGGYVTQNSQNSQTSSAFVNYVSNYAYLSARYSQYNELKQTAISSSGALVWASNRFFAANKIGDGFAIVNNAGPQTKIINGGVTLGETDSKGRFLISNLVPYQINSIYANPENLPLDWNLSSTEKSVMTGFKQGVQIDFDAKKTLSAIVKLVNKDNEAIKPGYSAVLNKQGSEVVGYDGEIFLQGLQKYNSLVVDLIEKGTCTVSFEYNGTESTMQKLGPYVCQ